MSEPEKTKTSRPESPTTARELDFDDDDVPTSPRLPKPASGTSSPVPKPSTEAAPPSQPTRPLSPREQAELTLREAFPSIDAGVVKAVLAASNGQVEPAFNALLGMTDPDSQKELPPPPQPPRPAPKDTTQGPGRSQLEQDELYARQLAAHYQNQDARRESARMYREDQQRRYREQDEPPERSFLDDDLPEIGENIRKGFLETQTKVNSFFANLKKRFDEEVEDEPPPQPPRRPTQGQPQYGQRSGEYGRRSSDRDRYDGDAAEISDDFTALQMNDNEAPRKTGRPQANPDLFKPTPRTPSEGRRVSFQEGPPEEISDDLYRRSPDPNNRPSSTVSSNKSSKWQPLAAVDPSPVGDHDPFSLGDSDEEEKDKKKDVKPEDTERLKKATAEAMNEELGSGNSDRDQTGTKTLGEAEITGTKDKTAEEKLTGKS